MIVRTMLAADLQPVSEIMVRAIATMHRYEPEVRAYMASLYTPVALADLLGGDTIIKVAVTHEAQVEPRQEILGAGCIARGQIFGMYVDPQHQRSGAGGRILRALEATQIAGTQIRVEASFEAVPFYERHGYQLVAKEEAAEPLSFPYWVMQKTIG